MYFDNIPNIAQPQSLVARCSWMCQDAKEPCGTLSRNLNLQSGVYVQRHKLVTIGQEAGPFGGRLLGCWNLQLLRVQMAKKMELLSFFWTIQSVRTRSIDIFSIKKSFLSNLPKLAVFFLLILPRCCSRSNVNTPQHSTNNRSDDNCRTTTTEQALKTSQDISKKMQNGYCTVQYKTFIKETLGLSKTYLTTKTSFSFRNWKPNNLPHYSPTPKTNNQNKLKTALKTNPSNPTNPPCRRIPPVLRPRSTAPGPWDSGPTAAPPIAPWRPTGRGAWKPLGSGRWWMARPRLGGAFWTFGGARSDAVVEVVWRVKRNCGWFEALGSCQWLMVRLNLVSMQFWDLARAFW